MFGIGLYLFVIHSHKVPLAAAGIGIALAGLLLEGRPLRVPPFLMWFGAWIAWGVLTMAWSPHPEIVWDRSILFAKVWLIGFAAYNAIGTPARLTAFVVLYLGMFALYPVRGTLFNVAFGHSTFGRYAWNFSFANFNELAAYTLLMLSLAIAMFHLTREGWVRTAALIGIFLLPVIVFLTQSRGGILGLGLLGLAILVGERARGRTLVAALAVAGVIILAAPESVWERVRGMRNLTSTETLRDADSSAEQRWLIWQVAGEVIRSAPVGGVGLGAYPRAHAEVAARNSEFNFARGERDTHSMYLNVLAETGGVGFLLFLGMLSSAYLRLRRAESRFKADPTAGSAARAAVALRAGLSGFGVAALFAGMHREAHLYLFLCIAVHLASMAESARPAVRRPTASGLRGAGGPARIDSTDPVGNRDGQ